MHRRATRCTRSAWCTTSPNYTYRILKKAGLAPRTFRIGNKEFVTEESAAAWRRMMDGKPDIEEAHHD